MSAVIDVGSGPPSARGADGRGPVRRGRRGRLAPRRRWPLGCGPAPSTRWSARSTCWPGRPLRALIEADRLSSVILWGPPGTGKTTLAPLIAGTTPQGLRAAVRGHRRR